MQEFEILGSGTSAVIVRDPIKLPGFVFKVQLTSFSKWSYLQETRFVCKNGKDNILSLIQKQDPEQKYFFYPKNEPIEEQVRNALLETKILSEMYGTQMQTVFRKSVLQKRWFDFALLPKDEIKILQITEGIPLLQRDWCPKQNRQAQECLQILHSIGIVHKDVHLWNFVLCPSDKRIRLIDFGEAEFLSSESEIADDIKNLDYISE